MSTRGVRLMQASITTGYTAKQLRYLATRNRIRWQKRGRFLLLHPEDVDALAAAAWNGSAFGREGGQADA